ncbi:MAG: L-aspartate oxidase [Tessaracoccus sp.]|uniref:L-aspartate oxidase n=1 Tax=Tessaracoccus sp. TaxID=1971211 RepID=UPI001ED3A3BA|nr:L-aspartate oxidase [Tessaracoccus sp.]MBK7821153.1 L-aspartate oxidase [Tessaracoccus sp.]
MLQGPASGATTRTGVVVVGTGAAGLSALLHLAGAGVDCIAVTRGAVTDSATAWAQGGLAAVWADSDSMAAHVADTLVAGAGLCDEDAVADLVASAPAAIARLIGLGARFAREVDGSLDLHLEGGHNARRIVHAGDGSGAEVERTLWAALSLALKGSRTRVWERTRLVDVLTDRRGRACGVRVLQDDGSVRDILADAVALATGGIGQLWPVTSNPPGATGDGVAAALRAGAVARDLEFMQFHPTVLADADARSRGVLISEAVRGEGALLTDAAGRRIMAGVHPLADLAPRDVVSAAIIAHLERTGEPHAFLDATAFGVELWEGHFPGILAMCRERGIDPVIEPIPVHPAAHYSCGGIAADLTGRTSVPGLFAVGEVAATGVHGANRLASNSLTEALVAGDRVGALLAGALSVGGAPTEVFPAHRTLARLVDPAALPALREGMQRHAFVSRDASGLGSLAATVSSAPSAANLDDASLTATNLHQVAAALVAAAMARCESRGAHRRVDFPTTAATPRRHLVRLDPAQATGAAAPDDVEQWPGSSRWLSRTPARSAGSVSKPMTCIGHPVVTEEELPRTERTAA